MSAVPDHVRSGRVFALFRVAAGPRLGHGHLRRAEALARALGRPACVSVRGTCPPTELRRAPTLSAARTLAREAPAVLVIDDPHAGHGARWCRAAARQGVPVVSLHDVGLARVPSSLAIDGSVVSPSRGWPAAQVLRGVQYAVIRPPQRAAGRRVVRRVLVSLGGGPRRRLTEAIAAALTAQWPDVHVVVPDPAAPTRRSPGGAITRVHAPAGLAALLASVDAAVVAGGLSLYEAVAAGVPTVAVAVVRAQQPAIRAFAARHLTVDGGLVQGAPGVAAHRVVRRFADLITDRARLRRIRLAGPRVVDGRGAQRVARAIATLADANARA